MNNDIDVETLRGRRAVNRWERTSVGDIFERLTWSFPDQVALIGCPGAVGDERFARVTNRAADRIANQVAHALAAHGLEPGARVLLFCDNSVEAYLTKIGIAKAGMVAMPVNPSLADDVIEHLVRQAEPGAAIVDAEHWPSAEPAFVRTGLQVVATIPIGGSPVAGTPSFSEFIAGQPDTEPDVEIHGDDIWQLLYTSGTTSMPKGVMLSHNSSYFAALNFALSQSRGLQLESDLVIGTFLPMIYHVADPIFTMAAFLCGGRLVIGRKAIPDNVASAIAAERITNLWSGSPQFLADLVHAADVGLHDLSSITVLIFGWGALPPPVYADLRRLCGEDLIAVGIFGQTEAIACHRFWPVKWPELHAHTAPAVNYVGVPSPLLASDVVDELGESVLHKPGETGEAVYRSPIVTAGYYREPKATEEAFRGDWFHSGDCVTADDDGLRIMVDRFKDIVKSGGENVSSLRVEAVLHQHADVSRAAVVGVTHERWGEAIVAVVVPRPERHPTEADIIAHCRSKLAGYESPKAVVFRDELPSTVGGKVLKYRLRMELASLFEK